MTGSPESSSGDEGAALRYLVGFLVDLRSKVADGKFASLLLIAYGIVTLQVLGLAHYDVTKAVSVLDSASLADLLLVVPAVTLLPVVGYVAASSALCFSIAKLGIFFRTSRPRKFGVFAFIGVGLVALFGFVVIVSVLPIAIAIITVICFALFLFPADATALSEAALHFTNIWSLSNEQVDGIRYSSAAERRRVGALLGGFIVVVGVSAAYPRPWMPARVLQLAKPAMVASVLHSCTDPHVLALTKDPRNANVAGYVIGAESQHLTAMSLNRDCMIRVAQEDIVSELVCRPHRLPMERTLWDLFWNESSNIESCDSLINGP